MAQNLLLAKYWVQQVSRPTREASYSFLSINIKSLFVL